MPKRLTTKEFVTKARKVHGRRYIYSEVDYVNSHIPVQIVCRKHGAFPQSPNSQLNGQGCPTCGGTKQSNTAEFIDKAIGVHGLRYDYSLVNYVRALSKVIIVCPTHGRFPQTPANHLVGHGCPACAGKKKRDTKGFIAEARKVHGRRYDYSKVCYSTVDEKVTIICRKHGPFEQSPYNHLKGHNCRDCSGLKKRTTESFISKAREVHGDYYDYSHVHYVNDREKVKIICPQHGAFPQSPNKHLAGQGCISCGVDQQHEQQRKTLKEFLNEARNIHGEQYDYSLVEYVNNRTPVTIICADHGEFSQAPEKHLAGQGCPDCAQYGFKLKEPALLYYLRIKMAKRKKPLYKVGITNNEMDARVESIGMLKDATVTVLYKRRYATGTAARRRERRILEENVAHRYRGKRVLKSGHSEVFTRDVLGKDLSADAILHAGVKLSII